MLIYTVTVQNLAVAIIMFLYKAACTVLKDLFDRYDDNTSLLI